MNFDRYIITDGKLAFIAIAKCASSSLKEAFKDLGWQTHHVERCNLDLANLKFFAVVREPLGRWISGFTQTFYRDKGGELKDIYRDLGPFVQKTQFDLHQMPQTTFLDGRSVHTFKLENLHLLREWLATQEIMLPPLIKKNIYTDIAEKRILYEYVEKTLTEEQKCYLLDYYVEDVKLYNSAV